MGDKYNDLNSFINDLNSFINDLSINYEEKNKLKKKIKKIFEKSIEEYNTLQSNFLLKLDNLNIINEENISTSLNIDMSNHEKQEKKNKILCNIKESNQDKNIKVYNDDNIEKKCLSLNSEEINKSQNFLNSKSDTKTILQNTQNT